MFGCTPNSDDSFTRESNVEEILEERNASALGEGYNSEVYSPEKGVICDKSNQFCVDQEGISIELTTQVFGASAREKWQAILNSENFDPTSYSMSSGLYCDSELRVCKTQRWDETENSHWTKILFGEN
jgi:hypothetical protein